MRMGIVVLGLAAGCGAPLSNAAQQIVRTTNPNEVRGCDDLGQVSGSAVDALEAGAARGATHVLWISADAEGTSTYGEAYDCASDLPPRESPAQPASGEVTSGEAAERPDPPTGYSGTCFFAADGIAITSAHVVGDATELKVIDTKGDAHAATVLRRADDTDLAVLDVPTAPVGHNLALDLTATANLGEDVFTIGFPFPDVLGSDPKFAAGAISGLSGFGDKRLFQITLPLQPGNSGGPLVTDGGQVIGVIAAKLDAVKTFRATGALPENVNFAVKTEELVPLMRGLALPPLVRATNRTDAIARTQAAVCRVVATVGTSAAPAPNAPADGAPPVDPSTQLSKAQIADTIRAMAPRLHPCWVSHKSSPFAQVKVVVNVAADGSVQTVDLADPGADRDARARCVGNVFQATRFPAAGGASTFRYTVKGE